MPRGVRLNPQHDERTRAKIQTSQIINRLHAHVNGIVELSATQVRAAEILLRKVMPDISTYHVEGHVTHSFLDFLKAVNAGPALEHVGPKPLAELPQITEEVRH